MKYTFCIILVLTTIHANAQKSGNKQLDMSNIFSFAILGNNVGPGLGLQYERLISKKFSVVVPLSICISPVPHSNSGHGGGGSGGTNEYPPIAFFEPGFRFYPTGTNGGARYCIGGSIIYGNGKGMGNTYTNGTNDLQSRTIFGFLIANAISFQNRRHFRTTLELDLGTGSDNGYNSGSGPLVQCSVAFGHRW